MAKNRQQYAETFSRMLQCATVTESGAEYFDKFQELLKAEFPLVFANLEVHYPAREIKGIIDDEGKKVDPAKDVNSRAILLRWKGKSSSRPMVLMAHQDVVPAVGGDWKYDPFSGKIADDCVWGRGAMDCKNTLFITINAVEELLESGFVPEQDVYLSYSDNEETGGPGAAYAVEWFKQHDIHPVVAVDEGGAIVEEAFPGMTKPFAMVGIVEKGYCDLKFVARSKGGHSSSPPKNTPIARLSAFVNYCETHNIFKQKMTAPALAMLNGMSPGLTGALRFITKHAKALSPVIVAGLPKVTPFGRALLGTTLTFTMSEGSSAPNVIPEAAWVVANLRLAPGDTSEMAIKTMKEIAAKYDIETEVLMAREHSAVVDMQSAEYKLYTETLAKLFPDIGISPYLMFGGTDCRRMQKIVPCAIRCTPCRLTPQQLESMHASNENIGIVSLVEGTAFFKEFIKNFK